MMGDIGGVMEVAFILFGLMLLPISEFSFYLKAISKLFLARVQEGSMMKGCAAVHHTHNHEVDKDDDMNHKM